MNELLAVQRWAVDALVGGATPTADHLALRASVGKRVYMDLAPEKDSATNLPPAYPLVILSLRDARDRVCVGGASAFMTALLDVKLVGTTGYADLATAANLIFVLLQQHPGALVGTAPNQVNVDGCHRTGLANYAQASGDRVYRYAVQTFKVFAHRLP